MPLKAGNIDAEDPQAGAAPWRLCNLQMEQGVPVSQEGWIARD
jgi:hypothetical protein